MVERRRKPLVLSSTKALLNSLLTTSRNQVTDRDDDTLSSQNLLPAVQLKTGVLQAELDGISVSQTKNSSGIGSIDSSALVGLSISVLKRLSITSGSLVLLFLFCSCLGSLFCRKNSFKVPSFFGNLKSFSVILFPEYGKISS